MFEQRTLVVIYHQFPTVFDVLVRIPWLIVLENILNDKVKNIFEASLLLENERIEEYVDTCVLKSKVCNIFILTSSFILVIFFLTLLTDHLMNVYAILIPALLIRLNWEMENKLLTDSNESIFKNIAWQHLFSQMCLSFCFNCILVNHYFSQKSMLHYVLTVTVKLFNFCLFCIPTVLHQFEFSHKTKLTIFNLSIWSLILEILVVTICLIPSIWHYFRYTLHLAVTFIDFFGLRIVLEAQWERLVIPSLICTFWILKIIYYLCYDLKDYNSDYLTILYQSFYIILNRGTDNTLSILGITFICSYFLNLIVILLAKISNAPQSHEIDFQITAIVLFYFLSVQTSITHLSPTQRYTRLVKNFALVSQALCRYTHGFVKTALLTVASMQSPISHHVGPIFVSVLISAYVSFLYYLFADGTWSFGSKIAIPIFSVEILLKVFFSFVRYTLLIIDSNELYQFEDMDNYVFWIKTLNYVTEYFIGILLFFNSIQIFYSNGGFIRALSILMHAYFNIYRRGCKGFNTFYNKYIANMRISRLLSATQQQLIDHSDICSVCFHDMETAKITECGHFYHAACLRQWSAIQQTCPKCQRKLFQDETTIQNDLGEENEEVVQ